MSNKAKGQFNKFCHKCQQDTNRNTSGNCKPCANAYAKKQQPINKKKRSSQRKEMRLTNKAKGLLRKYCSRCGFETDCYTDGSCKPCRDVWYKAYYLTNHERINAKRSEWHEANPESRRVSVNKWQKSNPDKVKAITAAWAKANPERLRANKNNRRAHKMKNGGKHTAADICNLLTLQKSKCACCKTNIKDNYHVDHVIALANGGGNDRLNLQLLCPTCNMQKSVKHPVDFMQSKGFLL